MLCPVHKDERAVLEELGEKQGNLRSLEVANRQARIAAEIAGHKDGSIVAFLKDAIRMMGVE